ncbi:MAG: hypothetical protein HY744_27225 [Deltaproteobacteria bacterium]|nr:hypothetical protein [Deltaproteobacteria bacterium]
MTPQPSSSPSQRNPAPGPLPGPSQRYFPHERLRAYELSRAVLGRVAGHRGKLRGLPGQAGAQLERAVVGAHTNLCAAAASQGADAKRQFRIALGEGAEAGGCLDAALLFGALGQAEHDEACARACGGLRGRAGPEAAAGAPGTATPRAVRRVPTARGSHGSCSGRSTSSSAVPGSLHLAASQRGGAGVRIGMRPKAAPHRR